MMKSIKCTPIAVALATVGLSLPTAAVEINWSGFLSVVGGKTLDDNTSYSVGFTGYDANYDDEISFEPESMAGLQAIVPVSDKLRATLQLVGRGADDFDIKAEWAFVTYDVTDELALSAGRMRLPLYYYSDFLDIGKAYYWIRPPVEIYNGPSSFNGVGAFYQKDLSDYVLSAQLWYGSETAEDVGVIDLDLDNSVGLAVSLNRDWWTLRAVYSEVNVDPIAQSIPGIPAGTSLGDFDVSFTGLAAIIDYDAWHFRSEYTASDNGTDILDAWYASVGYTIGKWTPIFTYTSNDGNADTGLIESTVQAVGVAYDLNASSVLKVEYLERDPEDSALDTTKLVTVGFDMVF